jgi:hypothetical protein
MLQDDLQSYADLHILERLGWSIAAILYIAGIRPLDPRPEARVVARRADTDEQFSSYVSVRA